MNSGIRDAHNLAWRLASVLTGATGAGMLDTYEVERIVAEGQFCPAVPTLRYHDVEEAPTRANAATR